MEDNLIRILESFGYPVYRQGSMSDDEAYPPTFITFRNYDTPDHSHYSNDTYGFVHGYNVFVYSNNPTLTYSVLEAIRKKLKEAGWITKGKGFDASSDEESHTGRGLDVSYLEIEN